MTTAYPAATLIAHGITVPGYKQKDGQAARSALLKKLKDHLELPANISRLENNDDALDAVICVLAGADFLQEKMFVPTDQVLARKEGLYNTECGLPLSYGGCLEAITSTP